MLIAIEGIDGVGKHTQTTAVAARLAAQGFDVSLHTFPDYDASRLGPHLKKLLAGAYGDAAKMHPMLSAPLFSLERAEQRKAIVAAIDAGKVVICDRYVYSNYAYQASRLAADERAAFRQLVEYIEFDLLGLPVPAVTVLLDAEDDVSSRQRAKRAEDASAERPLDGYERDSTLLTTARDLYHEVARLLDWKIVPVSANGESLARSEVTDAILAVVAPILRR